MFTIKSYVLLTAGICYNCSYKISRNECTHIFFATLRKNIKDFNNEVQHVYVPEEVYFVNSWTLLNLFCFLYYENICIYISFSLHLTSIHLAVKVIMYYI